MRLALFFGIAVFFGCFSPDGSDCAAVFILEKRGGKICRVRTLFCSPVFNQLQLGIFLISRNQHYRKSRNPVTSHFAIDLDLIDRTNFSMQRPQTANCGPCNSHLDCPRAGGYRALRVYGSQLCAPCLPASAKIIALAASLASKCGLQEGKANAICTIHTERSGDGVGGPDHIDRSGDG